MYLSALTVCDWRALAALNVSPLGQNHVARLTELQYWHWLVWPCKRDCCLIEVLLQDECGETDDITNDHDNCNDDGDESIDESKDKLKVEINEDQDNVDIDTDQRSDENDS